MTIEVIIRHVGSDVELGKITIENVDNRGEFADYSVRFGVEKITGVGLHQRGIHGFPRRKYNVLALLRQALSTLEPAELALEGDPDSKPGKSALRKNILRPGRMNL